VVNLGDTPVDVEVHLYHASGSRYGIVRRTLQPFEMTQYDRIYNRVNAGVSLRLRGHGADTGVECWLPRCRAGQRPTTSIFISAQRLSDTAFDTRRLCTLLGE
jgi:hypothetical protein